MLLLVGVLRICSDNWAIALFSSISRSVSLDLLDVVTHCLEYFEHGSRVCYVVEVWWYHHHTKYNSYHTRNQGWKYCTSIPADLTDVINSLITWKVLKL